MVCVRVCPGQTIHRYSVRYSCKSRWRDQVRLKNMYFLDSYYTSACTHNYSTRHPFYIVFNVKVLFSKTLVYKIWCKPVNYYQAYVVLKVLQPINSWTPRLNIVLHNNDKYIIVVIELEILCLFGPINILHKRFLSLINSINNFKCSIV